MAPVQTKYDHYSRTISNSAVSEFDSEPDPVKRFLKYAYTITNSEQAAIDALIKDAEAPVDEAKPGVPVTIRRDPEVVDYFKNTGEDWEHRINDALRAAIRKL